jgi:hypothetical protein
MTNQTPKSGYLFPLWNNEGQDYRATALAYMERENLTEVENINGRFYTRSQIKSAINGYVPSIFNQIK